MNISAATLLASQSALAAPKASATKSSEPPAEFSPLLFKKTAAAPVQSMAPQPAAPAPAPMKMTAATAPTPRAAYQRPGSTIDIKV